MAVTIHVNGKSNSLAHKGSMGIAKSTLPDVCKTPSPGGPVPIPYPVIVSMSSDLKNGSKTVKVDGGNSAAIKGSEFSRCTGDEPGTAGGVKSSTNMKEATWILYSFDVKIEGKNACRLSDKMMMNHGNTACLAGEFQLHVLKGMAKAEDCQECKRAKEEEGTESYDEFFDEEEKREFAQIAMDFPDSASILPPQTARYRVRSPSSRKQARKSYKKARQKAKKAGEEIDEIAMDHPHPLAHGGCPIHQTLATIETEDDAAADERKNLVLDKVNKRKGISS